MHHSDEELIRDYLVGDEESLALLIRRYLKPIYRFIYGYAGNAEDAQDLTQEAFVKVWRGLSRFDLSKKCKPWIFAIAKNTALDFLKKRKAIPFSEFENEDGENALTETLVDSAPLPRELLEKAGVARMIASTLEKLSPKYCKVLFLRYNDYFNFREIAESLGEPLNTVKSRHRRALNMLKNILSEF